MDPKKRCRGNLPSTLLSDSYRHEKLLEFFYLDSSVAHRSTENVDYHSWITASSLSSSVLPINDGDLHNADAFPFCSIKHQRFQTLLHPDHVSI